MRYEHTQTAPLFLILLAAGFGILIAAPDAPAGFTQIVLMGSGGVMFLLAFCFRQLTVRDEEDHLLISFGPLPLFRRRIRYADVKAVQQAKSTLLDGWGVHLSPSGGWTWNLWGFDCVDVFFLQGGKVRIGTDDPEGLTVFLQQRIEPATK